MTDEMDLDTTPTTTSSTSSSTNFLSSKDKGKGKQTKEVLVGLNVGENAPWVEKYRPRGLGDVIGQGGAVEMIKKGVVNKNLGHLLLHGPAGVGKTSTVLAAAREMYGTQMNSMVLELNASDERGIDVVRNEIKDFASTRGIFAAPFKLIVLDEADALTQAAQAALRRIIEKYTSNVRFCLIVNYVSKIIPALQSRCTKLRFAPLENEHLKERILHVVKLEKVTIDEAGMNALLKLSRGDMRKTLNILQATAAANNSVITEESIYLTTGAPLPSDIEKIVTWLLNENFNVAYSKIYKLKNDKGLALQDILTEIHQFVVLLELPTSVRLYLLDSLSQIE